MTPTEQIQLLREALEDAISLLALLPVEQAILSRARDSTRKKLHEALAATEATPPVLEVHEVQASYDRLREKIPGLAPTTYVRCDKCDEIKPRELVALHSPSGINHCKEECGARPKPTDAVERKCELCGHYHGIKDCEPTDAAKCDYCQKPFPTYEAMNHHAHFCLRRK